MDEADDEKMKELLKSHGAIETTHGEERSSIVPGMHVNIAFYFIQVCLCLAQ